MIIEMILLILFSIINSLKNNINILSIIVSFFVLFLPFIYILNKNKTKSSKKNIVISLIISVILICVTQEKFLINYKNSNIMIENTSNEYVLIDNVYLNKKKIKLNGEYLKKYDLINNAELKTEYKEQNKNTSEYKLTLKPKEKYEIDINKIKNIEINIQKKNNPISIKINNKKINIEKLNYKKITKKSLQMGNFNYIYSYNNSYIKYNINEVILLLLLFVTYFLLVRKSITDKKSEILALFVILIELNPINNINIIVKLFLIIIFGIIFRKEQISSKKYTNKQKIMFAVSSLYISFSFIGKFLIENPKLSIILFYILLSIFIYKLIPVLLNKIDNIKNKLNKPNKIIEKKNSHRILVFSICVLILLGYKFLLNPFIFVTDSYMQISDVLNNTLSNWHPYIHTMLLKMFYVVFGNFDSFIYFRIFIYSLLLNTILFYFNNKGLKLVYVYIIAILFTLSPVTATVLITLLKDVDFVIVLVALSFYLYLIVEDFKTFNFLKSNYFFLLISLLCVAFFRHNGIYISIIVAIFLFILSIKQKKIITITIIIFFAIISFIIKVPLYKILNVSDTPKNLDIATMIHGLDYIMVEDKAEYNNKTYNYLINNVLSEKTFKNSYNKYNIDILLHYNENDDNKKTRNLKLNKSKIINIYLQQMLKSPIYLLKDRLYGNDIVWNVVEDDKINNLKYQLYYDEFDHEYIKDISKINRRSKFIEQILCFISNNALFNILFFRIGIYIDLLIVFINYTLITKRKKDLVMLFPLLINLITLLIAMHYQAFRYVWMVFPITLMYILMTFFEKKTNDEMYVCK